MFMNKNYLYKFHKKQLFMQKQEIILDNQDYVLRLENIELNKANLSMNVYFENKSQEKTYSYFLRNIIIDGIQYHGHFYCTKELQPNTNDTNEFDKNFKEIKSYGLTEFSDIALEFDLYDESDSSSEKITKEIHIYPLGEENASKFVRAPKTTDQVLLDSEHGKAVVYSYEQKNESVYCVQFFFENKTEKSISFYIDEVRIEGVKIDTFFTHQVKANCSQFAKLQISKSDLEENNISEVKEIELKFRACVDFEDTLVNETFHLQPFEEEVGVTPADFNCVGKWHNEVEDCEINIYNNKTISIKLSLFGDAMTIYSVWEKIDGGIMVNTGGEKYELLLEGSNLVVVLPMTDKIKVEKISDTLDEEDVELNHEFFIGEWRPIVPIDGGKDFYVVINSDNTYKLIPNDAPEEAMSGTYSLVEGGLKLDFQGKEMILPANGKNIVLFEIRFAKV